MSATNIEVVKSQNETNANLIRRFTKKMQGSRVLKHAKKLRFFERPDSKLKKKEKTLKMLAKIKENERLKKLGKLKVETRR